MEEARALGKGVQSFSVVTTHFAPGDDGSVGALHYAHAQDAPPFGPVEGTEDSMPAQLVLLAMGFLHPEQGLVDGLGARQGRAQQHRGSGLRDLRARASSPPATRAAASR